MPPQEIERIRSELPEGFRLCAPWRPQKTRHKIKPSYCHRVKPERQFQVRRGRYINICNDCHRRYKRMHARLPKTRRMKREWHEHNREHINELRNAPINKRRRQERDEKRRSDPEFLKKRSEYMKRYYLENREEIIEKQRIRRQRQRALSTSAIPIEVAIFYIKAAQEAAKNHQINELEWQLTHPPDEVRRGNQLAQAAWRGSVSRSIDSVTGVRVLSEWANLSQRRISEHIAGRTTGIRQQTLDNMLIHTPYSLTEVIAESEAWAKETGDPWPLCYTATGWDHLNHGPKHEYHMKTTGI